MASLPLPPTFRTGPWLVEPERNLVSNGEVQTRLGNQVMTVLTVLAASDGRVIPRQELLDVAWEGRCVGDEALTVVVHELRKVLGDTPKEPRFIETVKGRGYRWVADYRQPNGDGAQARTKSAQALPPPSTALGPTQPRSSWPHLLLLSGALAAALSTVLVLALPGRDTADAGLPVARVALLPLIELGSTEGDNSPLARRLTGELIDALQGASAFRIVGHGEVDLYRGTTQRASVVAEELQADALVLGTVEQPPGHLRLNLTWIDAENRRRRWSRSFEQPLSEQEQLYREVGLSFAEASRRQRDEAGLRALNPRYSLQDMNAYRAALDQMQHDPEGAEEQLRQMLARVPYLAEAHLLLADIYLDRVYGPDTAPEVEIGKARRAIDEALALDPTLASAHLRKGFVQMLVDWDLDGAEESLQRTLRLDPGNATAHARYAWLLAAQGRVQSAKVRMGFAERLYPSDAWRAQSASLLLTFGDARAALAALEGFGQQWGQDLPHCMGWFSLASSLERLGQDGQAFDAYVELIERCGDPAEMPGYLDAYERGGLPAFYRSWLRRADQRMNRALIVRLLLRLGEHDQALAEIGRMVEEGNPLVLWLPEDPELAPLHADPRFAQLVRTMREGVPRVAPSPGTHHPSVLLRPPADRVSAEARPVLG